MYLVYNNNNNNKKELQKIFSSKKSYFESENKICRHICISFLQPSSLLTKFGWDGLEG